MGGLEVEKNYQRKFVRTALVLVAALAGAVATSGCGIYRTLYAKDRLNEGVREFNKGKFEQAQKEFEHALELSPDNINAQLFYARALNARFDQSLTEDLGLQTIKAYENLIKMDPSSADSVDRAYAFQADVYKKLGAISADKYDEYKKLQHEMLLKRVELPSAKPSAKADVYYTIGVDYWQMAYNNSSPYTSKKQPIPPQVQEKMKPLIQKAHEYLQKTVSVDPNYANAYFYEKLTYIEEAKVADATKQKDLLNKQLESQNMYMKITKEQQAAQGGQPGS